mmetsp:Transcript_58245/g.129854  ORF Transcript_58245/g.129854 Transcript_58245/m.129854 type:complete len:202 (-) Transcript_58245:436-1041(-)
MGSRASMGHSAEPLQRCPRRRTPSSPSAVSMDTGATGASPSISTPAQDSLPARHAPSPTCCATPSISRRAPTNTTPRGASYLRASAILISSAPTPPTTAPARRASPVAGRGRRIASPFSVHVGRSHWSGWETSTFRLSGTMWAQTHRGSVTRTAQMQLMQATAGSLASLRTSRSDSANYCALAGWSMPTASCARHRIGSGM